MITMSDEPSATDGQPRGAMRAGKLSYVQIPSTDVVRSGDFYERVFGWKTRRDGNPTHLSFEDASGELIGAFVTTRTIAREPGVVPYISVAGIDAVVALAVAEGAEVVRPVYAEGDLWVAELHDPAGNVIGVWQAGSR